MNKGTWRSLVCYAVEILVELLFDLDSRKSGIQMEWGSVRNTNQCSETAKENEKMEIPLFHSKVMYRFSKCESTNTCVSDLIELAFSFHNS